MQSMPSKPSTHLELHTAELLLIGGSAQKLRSEADQGHGWYPHADFITFSQYVSPLSYSARGFEKFSPTTVGKQLRLEEPGKQCLVPCRPWMSWGPNHRAPPPTHLHICRSMLAKELAGFLLYACFAGCENFSCKWLVVCGCDAVLLAQKGGFDLQGNPIEDGAALLQLLHTPAPAVQ